MMEPVMWHSAVWPPGTSSTNFAGGGRRSPQAIMVNGLSSSTSKLASSSAAMPSGNGEQVFAAPVLEAPPAPQDSWQLLSVTLHRTGSYGFGIAVSGGIDNPHFVSGDPAIVVSDVIASGPAWGLVQVNDRVLSVNGASLENADYDSAVRMMKECQQLNMIVKRRVPMPTLEFEQRTLKFTLTKSRKKDDFGIVLGCKFYIKAITNSKLAEKDPGLREGDTILRINGQSVEDVPFDEATKWLQRSREKLCLVVQRDVRRGVSTRWNSQNTVYERVGSVTATPRQSPSPMLNNGRSASTDYVNSFQRWSHPESEYGPNHSQYSGSIAEETIRTIRFRKLAGSVGVRVIGGNQVGIFVSAVQADSPAAFHQVRPGDKLLSVNERSMQGVTREQAVQYLLAVDDNVTMRLVHARNEFEHVRAQQLGDNFFIRTHFDHPKTEAHLELPFHNGDIFHVTDTLFGGTVGFWQATKVYSPTDSALSGPDAKGVIPNQSKAEALAKQSRSSDTSTIGRSTSTFFRRKLSSRRTKSLTKGALDDVQFGENEFQLPAYERVTLRHPGFLRPIVIFGPLADIARQLLVSNFSMRFASPPDEGVLRPAAIDSIMASNRHCVLDVTPGSVERLQLAQYAPIVLLVDVESRTRIRELRARAGGAPLSTRKLLEQTNKIKKHHSHLFTATLDASKEDGWFDAVRELIGHLQDRRVWTAEFGSNAPLDDLLLFPMANSRLNADSDGDSLKGEYSTSDYLTRRALGENNDPSSISGPSSSSSFGADFGVSHSYPHRGEHWAATLPRHRAPQPQSPTAAAIASLRASGASPTRRRPLPPQPITVPAFPGSAAPPLSAPAALSANTATPSPVLPATQSRGVHRQQQPQREPPVSPGYYDVKQILAEQAEFLETNRSFDVGDRTRHPVLRPHAEVRGPLGAGARSGGFYDHLTRNRYRPNPPPPQERQEASPFHRVSASASSQTPVSPLANNIGQTNAEIARENGFNGNDHLQQLDAENTRGDRHSASIEEPIVIEHMSAVIDEAGGELVCPSTGVTMRIPPGALDAPQEIYIKVCRENGQYPPLDESRGENLISPVVMCGPQGLQFREPVELRLPHSASANSPDQWCFSLKAGTGAGWKQVNLDDPDTQQNLAEKFVTVKIQHF